MLDGGCQVEILYDQCVATDTVSGPQSLGVISYHHLGVRGLSFSFSFPFSLSLFLFLSFSPALTDSVQFFGRSQRLLFMTLMVATTDAGCDAVIPNGVGWKMNGCSDIEWIQC